MRHLLGTEKKYRAKTENPTWEPELLPEQRPLSTRQEENAIVCYSRHCSVSLPQLHPRRGLVKTKGNCSTVSELEVEFSFTGEQMYEECAGIHH